MRRMLRLVRRLKVRASTVIAQNPKNRNTSSTGDTCELCIAEIWSIGLSSFDFRRAMICKRGLCILFTYAEIDKVEVMCVCVPVTFIHSVKTSTFFHSRVAIQAILVFPYQTTWQYSDGGVQCRWGSELAQSRDFCLEIAILSQYVTVDAATGYRCCKYDVVGPPCRKL